MPRRLLTENEAADVAVRYAAGATIDQLAVAFGVSNNPIRAAIVAAGVPFRTTSRRPRVLDEQQSAAVVARYRDGETIDELAAAFGVSTTPIRRALLEADVEIRRRSHRPLDLDVDEIVRRYEAGETLYAIGRALDVDANTIKRRLKAAGVDRRRLGRPPKVS